MASIDDQVSAFLAAWYRTRQTVMEANFHRAHQQGLSTTQFLLLNLLDQQQGPWTLRTVAAALHLESATVVQTVDSLEHRGLVARQRATTDRRRVHLQLTDAGRAVQSASQQAFHERLTIIFAGMLPPARQALVEGLTAFADAATTLREGTSHDQG
jgi:DNA-binding MarR family transcriptional regulator